MVQDSGSHNNGGQGVESEDDWDDLEFDDLDDDAALDEEFEEELPLAPAADTPVPKKKRRSFLMMAIAVATLGSVSWLALTNSSLMVSIVSQIGQDVPSRTIQIDESAYVSADVQGHEVHETIADLSEYSDNSMQDMAIPDLDDTSFTASEIASQMPEADISAQFDSSGVLTPMPDVAGFASDEDFILADLDSDDVAPAFDAETPEIPQENEAAHSSEIEAGVSLDDALTEVAIDNSASFILEEDKFSVETEKPFVPFSEVDILSVATDSKPKESDELAEITDTDSTHKIGSDIEKEASEQEIPEAVMPMAEEPIREQVQSNDIQENKEVSVVASVAAPKPQEKKVSDAAKVPATPVEAITAPPVPQWELRSASNSSALIYDKRSGELLSIGVGSLVRGIGRVQSIERKDGLWVVVGSGGSIRQ